MSKRLPKDATKLLAEIGRLRKMADAQAAKAADAEAAKTKLYAKINRCKRGLYVLGWKG